MNEKEIKAGLAVTPGYRYARRVGERLLIAGQVPLDGCGALVGVDDPAAQAGQCLENLKILLRCHGFDLADVQQLTVHVVGPREHLTAAWAVVTRCFTEGVPPATLLGVPVLGHAGQLVEIDATVIHAGSE